MSPEPAGAATIDLIAPHLRAAMARPHRPPFVLRLCGAQGIGKSTVSAALRDRLVATGLNLAILSIDDLYLPREEREALARVHPLLRTRGVPGTHTSRLARA